MRGGLASYCGKSFESWIRLTILAQTDAPPTTNAVCEILERAHELFSTFHIKYTQMRFAAQRRHALSKSRGQLLMTWPSETQTSVPLILIQICRVEISFAKRKDEVLEDAMMSVIVVIQEEG